METDLWGRGHRREKAGEGGHTLDYQGCISQIQTFLQNSPLIVLGSGASIPYGLPSMQDIATEIERRKDEFVDPNFNTFCSTLSELGLESALDQAALQLETNEKIREIVWEYVNLKDLRFLSNYSLGQSFVLAELINKVLQPTPNRATIVTTNYDRLAEHAADHIGATAITGFEGLLIRKMEFPTDAVVQKRVRARERQVEIWKVHGSLDWFAADDNILSIPLGRAIQSSLTPLIIPPGKDKYQNTYKEPYRSVIAQADAAFLRAGAYLCIGYGFNDEHIQPKLVDAIGKGRPIVVLAKKMTEACRSLVIESSASKFVVLESASKGKTKAYGNGWESEYDGDLWDLEQFMKIW